MCSDNPLDPESCVHTCMGEKCALRWALNTAAGTEGPLAAHGATQRRSRPRAPRPPRACNTCRARPQKFQRHSFPVCMCRIGRGAYRQETREGRRHSLSASLAEPVPHAAVSVKPLGKTKTRLRAHSPAASVAPTPPPAASLHCCPRPPARRYPHPRARVGYPTVRTRICLR
jgi:hypothetical protein